MKTLTAQILSSNKNTLAFSKTTVWDYRHSNFGKRSNVYKTAMELKTKFPKCEIHAVISAKGRTQNSATEVILFASKPNQEINACGRITFQVM